MNTDPHSAASSAIEPFQDFLADLASLGVSATDGGGIAYCIMRARSNARWWLLPASQGRVSSASIAMYQPASRAGRLVRPWIGMALRLGIDRGWASGRIRFDRLPRLPGPALAGVTTCAYFTGTDGPHRKTAIQLMDGCGGILGYAKLSRRAAVRPYLSHEARMLAKIERLKLTSAEVPKLLAFSEADDGGPTILVTDSRKTAGTSSPSHPAAAHVRFLAEMARRTGRTGASSAYRELVAMASDRRLPEEWTFRFGAGLQRLAPAAPTMPVALAHGDFTPWNSFVLQDRLYVFDWEYAAEDRPAGYDLVQYIVAVRGGADAGSTVEHLIKMVAEAFYESDKSVARPAVLMSLLLHAAFYLRRENEAGGDARAWADGAVRGRIVDVLLHGRG